MSCEATQAAYESSASPLHSGQLARVRLRMVQLATSPLPALLTLDDAGPARPDLEYAVGWKVPSRLAPAGALMFCVTSRVVGGPSGAPSCAPLRIRKR